MDTPPATTGTKPPKLLDTLRAAIRRKHLSYATEEAYVGWVRRFVLFHRVRHPNEMGEDEIRQFLSHLAVEWRSSAARGPAKGPCPVAILGASAATQRFSRVPSPVRDFARGWTPPLSRVRLGSPA